MLPAHGVDRIESHDAPIAVGWCYGQGQGVDWIAPGHDVALATFYFIVAWQLVCFAWHAERVVQFWNTRHSG